MTFPILVQLLSFSSYRLPVLEGLIASIGGVTKSLVRGFGLRLAEFAFIALMLSQVDDGTTALVSHLQAETDSRQEVCNSFLAVFARHAKDDRVIVPLIKTLSVSAQ